MVTLWELVSLGVQSTEYGVPSGTGASHLTPAKGTNVSNMTPMELRTRRAGVRVPSTSNRKRTFSRGSKWVIGQELQLVGRALEPADVTRSRTVWQALPRGAFRSKNGRVAKTKSEMAGGLHSCGPKWILTRR